ncbi:putative bromodomain-containing protein 10 [Stigmatopora nigra]
MSSTSTCSRTGCDDMDLNTSEDSGLSHGASVHSRDHPATSNDGISDFSNSDISLPEVCVTSNFEENMSHEVQQAYRIFSCFLLDKHKAVAGLFLHAVGHQEEQCGVGGVCAPGQARLEQSICLRSMEEKFVNQEYRSITEFVADFRLMLENCYRYHGVDHWLSKQAQKMEIMLEQKLTLLSRSLREKTTLAETSKGRFGSEEERTQGGTSTRRRMSSRSLATITVGGHESLMVHTLRMEEQQRAKEEKRQRDLEKKEAEEISAKAVEEWDQTLLLQASPFTVDTLWELPAIGHFLCLAQTVLNLPEIVFFELERCLLMPRCSSLLSKIMSSLLSPWQRRATLHRRPPLPYRRWEAELRLRVTGWYRSIGRALNQPARARQLGLCHQFFRNLGETSPLEEKPFHLLPFCQRVWLLKGLCDNVYETQKDVQDAVLAQPIHECRESILGYDSRDNAYIHFPHFCGADLRIYCQSPSTPPAFPFPSALVKRLEEHAEESDVLKGKDGHPGIAMYVNNSSDFAETLKYFTEENRDRKKHEENFRFWPTKKEDEKCESELSDGHSSNESTQNCHTSTFVSRGGIKQETAELKYQPTTLEKGPLLGPVCTVEEETRDPCLNVGEHTYTGRSPAHFAGATCLPSKHPGIKMEEVNLSAGHQQIAPCLDCHQTFKTLGQDCSCQSTHIDQNSRSTEQVLSRPKKKKCKKKRGRSQLRHQENFQAAESEVHGIATNIQRTNKRKKHKEREKVDSAKKSKADPTIEPSFKLVCSSLQDLRDLISKTEDELDDLESTKKKLDRWYLRKEAVKDLHSTLIRLLNELSPWEPKLLKAYHRNRLRLKKEFDDFKKHTEYSNFVREECVSSSSSSDNEEMQLMDHQQRSEDELEHVVPRRLWTKASTGDCDDESVGENSPTLAIANHEKYLETAEQLSRDEGNSSNTALVLDNVPKSKCEMLQSNIDWTVGKPIHPTTEQPKRYTAIPTLFAKSVGNKVTLMKRPVDYPGVNYPDRQSLRCSSTKLQGQAEQSTSQQNSLPTQGECAIRQLEIDKVAATPLATCLAKENQTLLQSPLQVLSNDQKGFRNVGSSLASTIVQPVLDCSRQEIVMEKVVNLPSNHVAHKSEEQQSQGAICLSTNVPGFTIPDHIQQVVPQENAHARKTPSLFSSTLHQHSMQPSQSSVSQTVRQNSSSFTSAATLASAIPPKLPDNKQELRTICIRDSQSILVTTRGGNTGIVKVQRSSAQNSLDSLATSPIITISPQFKAFLVSNSVKASSVPCQKNLCPTTTVANSLDQSHEQISSKLKASANSNTTNPRCLGPRTSIDLVPGAHKSDGTPFTGNISHPAQSPALQSSAGGIAQADVVGRPGLKRPSADDQSKIPKFILVSNSPSSGSTLAVAKDESSSKPSLGSRFVLIDQHSSPGPCALVGSGLNQSTTARAKGEQLTTANRSLERELNCGVHSNVIAEGSSVTLPPGVQIQVPGMTTTKGHAIGTQSCSTSKKTSGPVMSTGPLTQSTPFAKSSTVTGCLPHLVSNASLTRSSEPSLTIAPQPGSFKSNTTATLATHVLPSCSPVQGNPNPTSMATLAHHPSHLLTKETTPITSTFPKTPNMSIGNTQSVPVNNLQQRIVINISKPLVAGTQILLDNVCFMVPPQGLAPGNHVLVISSPPQKVPHLSGSYIGSALPPEGVSQGPTTPQGQFLTGSQTRLPHVPAGNSLFLVPEHFQGPSLLAPKTNLLPAPNSQVGSSASPGLSHHPQLGKQAPHVSSVITSRLGLDYSHSTIRLTPSTSPSATFSNTVSPVNPASHTRFPAPSSTLPSPISISKVLATTQGLCIQEPSTAPLGLDITSVSQQGASVIHQGCPGSLTSTIQNLTTPTVPSIESNKNVTERAYVLTLSPATTQFQPITQLTTNPIQQSVGPSTPTLVKPTLQNFHIGMAKHVANKLLISPSAILSSVQCQAKAVEANVYPKQTALIITPNSSYAALHYQPTPGQPNN